MAKFVTIGERLSTTAPAVNKAFSERDPEPILKRAKQQLLLCSLQDRLRISLGKCLIYSRCCGGKSLTDGNKFCHSFVLLLL